MTAPEISVRACHALADYEACIAVQKQVWAGADIDVVPLPLFVVVAETGGQVLGAFAGGRMVGFTLAMPAFHGEKKLLHSHMTAVVPEFQNHGIGRQLKLFQREDALRRGIDLVEWTFDPLEIRNAHFNLVRLGAIARRFIPNCYGITSSPLHAGLPTDRLVVEWWLASPRVIACVSSSDRRGAACCAPASGAVRIRVPADIAQLKLSNAAEAARLQQGIREQFQRWFGHGYVVTGFEIHPQGGDYVLEPKPSGWPLTAES